MTPGKQRGSVAPRSAGAERKMSAGSSTRAATQARHGASAEHGWRPIRAREAAAHSAHHREQGRNKSAAHGVWRGEGVVVLANFATLADGDAPAGSRRLCSARRARDGARAAVDSTRPAAPPTTRPRCSRRLLGRRPPIPASLLSLEVHACLAIADAVRAQPTLLATICLRANYIGREGATALVNAARSNAVLRMLDLRDNEISGDVVREPLLMSGRLLAMEPPTQMAASLCHRL